ncbi:outer membrane protein [Aurantimonas sp. Leaf443]|uniref:outer membrane protein n=1 Tax=Aurantimonas sp. Leaf443 TaxID=1736378 RepID=UPI0006F8D777|nr:outer membrane protein [Aurantimonas sp. Leaf443]KQT88582.1 cell envelope biogenesis protein OmpA [Aurantimonas sp. Leaf443]
MTATRILAGLGLLALLQTPALAADAVTEAPMPAPVPAYEASPQMPIHVWSGPYAGAFVGYNATEFDRAGGASFDGNGFVGGVYAGYNLQTDALVYGIEGDIGGGDFDARGVDGRNGSSIDGQSNVFGSLRGRVGVAVDPFLVFATGGVAAAQSELSLDGASDTKTSVGYTLGAGVETRITDSVTSRLEYRYSDFGKETYDLGNTSVSSGFDEHSIRAGVALKF